MPENDGSAKLARWFVMLLAALVVSTGVMNVTLTSGDFNIEERTNLHKMIRGTAHRPFVYRAATPLAIRTLTDLTPDIVRQKIEAIWLDRELYDAFSMPKEDPVEGTWTYLVMLGALMGFFFILRLLVLQFYDVPDFVALLISMVGVLCLPLYRIWFIYDFPNLLVFSTALLLLARQSWKGYYPVFLVACFTKETSALLPFIFFVSFPLFRGSKRAFFTHWAVQTAIWLTVYISLRLTYQSNPGSLMEFHLFSQNLPLLWENPGVFFELSKYLMPGQLNIVLLAFLAIFVFRDWSAKPLFLRRAVLAMGLMLVLAFLFAYIEETRQYVEMYPTLFLLCLPSVMRVFGFDPR